MPEFPQSENQILSLANQMYNGYLAHGADFPSVNKMSLRLRRNAYRNARKARLDAKAQVRIATGAKNVKLARLRELMKSCLRKSEVDVGSDSEKLEYIGWGPRTGPQPPEAPAAPGNLHAIAEGQGLLQLAWDRPASGGPVRNYIIERRGRQETGGEFGHWSLVGSALNNELNLNGQPRGVQTEYRVKAAGAAGESIASNTAAVVL
jgi:hypothetical protein